MSYPFNYPVTITPDDNHTFMVTFPDIPEAITFGNTHEKALKHASACLDTALAFRIKEGRDIPKPSRAKNHLLVFPSALVALKSLLYMEMRHQGLRKSDMVKKLGCSPKIVDRIMDAKHHSTFSQMETAFNAIGKHMVIYVETPHTT